MTDSMNRKAEGGRQKTGAESHPREWVDRSSPAYNEMPGDWSAESHPREWVDRSSPAYNEMPGDWSAESHPREWVDRSSPAYNEMPGDWSAESHPREWVDRSSPAYNEMPGDWSAESHPREWVDRSSPAYNEMPGDSSSESHPREWVDRSSPAYKDISWAYQLHYYLCFRTHRRKKLFSSDDRMDALSQELSQICERHGYHLLRAKGYPDHLRCLLSLRPSDSISRTLQTVKTNLSRNLGLRFQLQPPVWADGFLARSVGRVQIDVVKHYLDSQSEHHGYAGRALPPVFRFVAKNPKALTAAHSVFDLNHHIVLATRYRRGIFGSRIGHELLEYWERVATKKGFAIDRATVLPDHVHLLVRVVPKLSIEDCVLALMNNGQNWFGKRYPELLVRAGIDQLWQPSAYAGTSGKVTTALVKSFLSL